MKNLLFGLVATLFSYSATAQSQYALVDYDAERASFNQNQPLPAERFLNITGLINDNIQIVEVSLFDSKSNFNDKALYQTSWRCKTDCKNQFIVPLNFKLRGDGKYDFTFKYYRGITAAEKAQLTTDLSTQIKAYILQAFSMSKKKISLSKSSTETYNDINDIMVYNTKNYRSFIDQPIDNFSELVKLKLEQIDNTRVKRIKKLFKKKLEISEEQKKVKAQLLLELQELIDTELSFRLREVDFVLDDLRKCDNYPVEKVKSVLNFDAGFAGVFLNSDVQKLQYGTSPYLGLSFPLGNRAFASKFLSSTSISIGVMLQNIKTDSQTYTGPVIGVPLYLGVGYAIMPYLNLQAGGVLLENKATNNINISPYIGLSLKLNLGLGSRN